MEREHALTLSRLFDYYCCYCGGAVQNEGAIPYLGAVHVRFIWYRSRETCHTSSVAVPQSQIAVQFLLFLPIRTYTVCYRASRKLGWRLHMDLRTRKYNWGYGCLSP